MFLHDFLLYLQQRHIAMAFPGGGMPPGGLEGLLGGLGMGPGALDNIWENPMVTSSSFELQYIKSLQMCSRQYFEYIFNVQTCCGNRGIAFHPSKIELLGLKL